MHDHSVWKSLKQQLDALHLRLSHVKLQTSCPAHQIVKGNGDRASASVANEISDFAQAQADNLLRAVNAALGRIDIGTLGECCNRNHEIGVQRLEAIPWTRGSPRSALSF
jgi:RNA polymerase-binding transcription factor DksA